jgi:formylglycine-generating enzyme required for sulfatase activity
MRATWLLLLACTGCATHGGPTGAPAVAAVVAAPGFPAAIGQRFRDAPYAPELVVIPPGSFIMGSTDAETTREGRRAETAAWERPQHRVDVATPLAVGRYFVTRGEYAEFVAATQRVTPDPCNVIDGGKWQPEMGRSFADPAFPQTDTHPATCVVVADAEAYAQWLSARTGHRYRLLHEAEWEYAARAGTSTSRWWGDERSTLCAHANGADLSYDRARAGEPAVNRSCDDGYVFTNPGDAFPPNPFGLHDMLGNLWQWTADCFVAGYDQASTDASADVVGGDCTRRAIRGASWHNYPDALRSAARFALPPTMRSASIGFRVVRLPDAPAAPAAAARALAGAYFCFTEPTSASPGSWPLRYAASPRPSKNPAALNPARWNSSR